MDFETSSINGVLAFEEHCKFSTQYVPKSTASSELTEQIIWAIAFHATSLKKNYIVSIVDILENGYPKIFGYLETRVSLYVILG